MSQLSAVVLAVGGASPLGDSAGGPACLVEFAGRPYLWWLRRYLDAWGIGDRSIVADESHRDWFDDHDPSLGQVVFVGGSAADPLAALLDVLSGVEVDDATVLLISGNVLPPPFDPHDLLIPDDSDAVACIAVGPLSPGWRLGFAVTGRTGDPAGSVVEVVEDASHAVAAGNRFMSSFAMTAVTAEALWHACQSYPAPHRMGSLLSRWASDGALLARCYDLPHLRFTTAVELAAVRAEFDDWRAAVTQAIGSTATPDAVDGTGDA